MSTTTETTNQSAEVIQAFADLDRARTTLAAASELLRVNRNALLRYTRNHGIGCKLARRHMYENDRAQYTALLRAESDHDFALRTFRRVAMIAALTRVIDTDRRLNAA